MGKVTFTGEEDHVIAVGKSDGRGSVLRSEHLEIGQVQFKAGEGARPHRHPEEQTFYVIRGRLRAHVGEGDDEDVYEVGPGEGSFHPSDVIHFVEALEDTTCISIKNVVDPTIYPQTGRLDE